MRRAGSDVASELRDDPFDRHHLRQLVGPPVHHRDVVIRAVSGGHLSGVLQIAIAVISPHGVHAGRDREVALLHQSRAFLPEVGDERRVGTDRAHDADLLGHRVPDQVTERVVVVADAGIEGGIARIGQPAETDGPQNVLAGRVRRHRVFPRALQDLGMAAVRVRHVLGPARDVHAQRNGVMRRYDQPAPAGERDLGLVGENPRPRRREVSLEPQCGLVDLVPHVQGNARVFLAAAWRPAGQQIFIVDEEAAIPEHRRRIRLVQRCGDFDRRPARRDVIGPVVQRIDAKIPFRELIDGVDRPAHVRAGEEHDAGSRRAFPDRLPDRHRERFGAAGGSRSQPLEQRRAIPDQDRCRTRFLSSLHESWLPAQHLLEI